MARSAAAQKSDRPVPISRRASRAKKISITVDERVLHQVERAAERSGRTLSAHITDALTRDLRQRALEKLIDDYERDHGVITEPEMESIRRQWQG